MEVDRKFVHKTPRCNINSCHNLPEVHNKSFAVVRENIDHKGWNLITLSLLIYQTQMWHSTLRPLTSFEFLKAWKIWANIKAPWKLMFLKALISPRWFSAAAVMMLEEIGWILKENKRTKKRFCHYLQIYIRHTILGIVIFSSIAHPLLLFDRSATWYVTSCWSSSKLVLSD